MVFIDVAAFTIVFPLIPDLMAYYLSGPAGDIAARYIPRGDMAVVLGGAATSLWAFVQFFSAPLWGRISDRRGRRNILVLCMLGLSLAHCLWGFATNVILFFAYRFIGGVMSGNISVAHAVMADITGPDERTRNMGLMGAAAGFGMIIGPVMGGILGHAEVQRHMTAVTFLHPFSLCAFGSALLFALNAFLVGRMPETLRRHDQEDAEDYSVIHLRPGFALRGFALLALLNFIYSFSMAGIELIFPYFLKFRFALGPSSIGLVFLFIGVVMAGTQILAIPSLTRRLAETGIIVLGFALIPASLVTAVMLSPNLPTALGAIFPISFGIAVIGPAIVGQTSRIAPHERQGYILGILNAYGSLAYALGPLFAAACYGFMGLHAATATLAFLFAVGFFLALRVRKDHV